METLEVRAEEEQLDALAIELFTKHESQFIPLYPWVLVRVLPREQMIGHIILPDNKSQNKPVHEGIVLQTWKSFLEYKTIHSEDPIRGSIRTVTHVRRYSEFVPGDHVCYPHWTGLAVPGWDERYYRIVPECVKKERGIEFNGIILGKLTYPKLDVGECLQSILASNTSAAVHERIVAMKTIKENFDIVYKEKASKTVSGR